MSMSLNDSAAGKRAMPCFWREPAIWPIMLSQRVRAVSLGARAGGKTDQRGQHAGLRGGE